jgi:putative ABC transport system permease protein
LDAATLMSRPTTVYRLSWPMRLPYALRNVLRRWRDLLGMMVGVGIALGIVMTLSGIGKAVLEIYTVDFKKSGADLYVTTQGGKLIPILPSDTPGTLKNARHTIGAIRALPGVETAVGVVSWTMERELPGPKLRDAPKELFAVMGVDGDPSLIPGMLVLNQGRWLRRSDEIVLGAKLAAEKHFQLGDLLRLNGRDFRVVGIGRLRGFGWSLDSSAFIDEQPFHQRVELGDVLSIIAVDTPQPESVRARLPEVGSVSSATASELVRQAETTLADRLVTYYILDALALAIGALFVSNMLSHSVAERRLEFATLRAIGIPTRSILLTVALEASLISLVAGVLGVGLSLALGWGINNLLAPRYQIEFLYSADATLFGEVFLLALALGLVAGLFPARAATRVDPVDVLREA